MAAFTVPSFSDDDDDDALTANDKQSLFERRNQYSHYSTATQRVGNEAEKPQDGQKPSTSSSSIEKKENKPASSKITEKTIEVPPKEASKVAESAASTSSPFRILVNKKQKGNPILKFIRNVPWEYDVIVPDYELGRCTCALYLSIKYHNRFPEYIHSRLKELGKSYDLRILLVQVDTKQQDISHELNQLARICILADCTMILAFSFEEAGRYLEVYKAYENKPPTDIMGKTKTDFLSQATEFLTAVKGVNKTDVTTLLSRFKTIKAIIHADVDSLSLCPGIGPVKARRLHNAFTTPFIKPTTSDTSKKHALGMKPGTMGGTIDNSSEEDEL